MDIEATYDSAYAAAQDKYQARLDNIKDLDMSDTDSERAIAKAKIKLDDAIEQAAMEREDALAEIYTINNSVRDSHPELVIDDGEACQIVCIEYGDSNVFLYLSFYEPWYGYHGRTHYGWSYHHRYRYNEYRTSFNRYRHEGHYRYHDSHSWRSGRENRVVRHGGHDSYVHGGHRPSGHGGYTSSGHGGQKPISHGGDRNGHGGTGNAKYHPSDTHGSSHPIGYHPSGTTHSTSQGHDMGTSTRSHHGDDNPILSQPSHNSHGTDKPSESRSHRPYSSDTNSGDRTRSHDSSTNDRPHRSNSDSGSNDNKSHEPSHVDRSDNHHSDRSSDSGKSSKSDKSDSKSSKDDKDKHHHH